MLTKDAQASNLHSVASQNRFYTSPVNYAVIRRFTESVNRFSLIHFKGGLISGIEIIGSLNTRSASLKSICRVMKVRSAPQKSTQAGVFFSIFRLSAAATAALFL
ncbi:hypothetical protein ACR3LR_08940 [Pantoea eucalypti]|uniref:hypothetical protein n=1 Tax=Pantoea eucalypti TaxID=470933 RepID=UPI003EE4E5F8